MFWTPPWLLVAVISPMLLALARMHLLCWIFCARSKDVLKIVLLLKSSKCHVPRTIYCTFKSDLTPMAKRKLCDPTGPKNTQYKGFKTLSLQIVVTGRDGGEGRAAGQLQLPGGAGEGQDHGGHHGPHPQVSQDPRHILRQREVSRT